MRKPFVGWVALAAGAVGVAFWAGVRVGSPAVSTVPDVTPALYTVVSGTVGSQMSMPATVTWPHQSPVRAPVGGTVTAIAAVSGGELSDGGTVLTVNLRPIVIANGSVPAFRDLESGVRGADVTQLQELLRKKHPTLEASGTFDEATATAVRVWQQRNGFPTDGIVHLGDVVFVGQLPARFALSEDVQVGSMISAGQQLGSLVTGSPAFQIDISDNQQSLVPQTGTVTVQGPGGVSWHAVITSATADTQHGGLKLALGPRQPSATICADQCDSVAVPGPVNLPATIDVVPKATGPVVPVGSLITAPNGATAVVRQDGVQVPVTIQSSAKGLAVVSGVEVGTRIQVLAAGNGGG